MQAQTAAYPKIMIDVCDLGSVALKFIFTTASSRAPWHSEIPIQLDYWPHSCRSLLAFVFVVKRGLSRGRKWVTVADALPPSASPCAVHTYSPANRSVSHSHLHVRRVCVCAAHSSSCFAAGGAVYCALTTCTLPPPSLLLLLYSMLFNAVLVGHMHVCRYLKVALLILRFI